MAKAPGSEISRAALQCLAPGLVVSSLLFVLGLELSVFGFPPLAGDPDRPLLVIWSILLASLVAVNVAFVGAVARDLEAG